MNDKLKRQKVILEQQLDYAVSLGDKYPKLADKYRELLADIAIEEARARIAANRRGLKRRKRGQA